MKTLRQLCAGLILTLGLTVTASAGQMDCPGVTASSQPTVAGYIPNGITAEGEMQYGLLLLIVSLV
jgi:hypothetical protein